MFEVVIVISGDRNCTSAVQEAVGIRVRNGCKMRQEDEDMEEKNGGVGEWMGKCGV